MKIKQEEYHKALLYSRNLMAKALRDDKEAAQTMTKAHPRSVGGEIEPKDWSLDHPLVKSAGRKYMKLMYEVMQKAGVSTSLGFNFFDLRGPAYFIFPLLTPFIQMIGKEGAVNAGTGTVAHWKATRNPNVTNVYGGVSEGQRNATATPDEIDYYAIYKELGQEGGETFTAQWAGEGYTDNLADEHFRNLARVRLTEEMMTIGGNSGTGNTGNGTGNLSNLGFVLGQPATPTLVLASGGALGSGVNVFVAVVAITWCGMNPGGQAGYAVPPSIPAGLTTNYVRQNADGTTTNVQAGVSMISNVSAAALTNAGAQTVVASTTAIRGAVAYAWYLGTGSNALSNLKIVAITPAPTATLNALPLVGAQTGAATGLNVDNSANPLDFDGLATYSFVNGLWTDMNGGSFTPAGNGQVLEIENDLRTLWTKYQAAPDAIWCSADVRQALESAIVFSATGQNSIIFAYTGAQQVSGLTGGFAVTVYKSKYSINPEGGDAIPIRIHPMFPPGTLMYDINKNPYMHSRIPAVRKFLAQRDYYAIEWPVTTRTWTFGTYVHEVLAHYVPWITAIRTSVGPFVAPCWLAALAFDEDFTFGPRVNIVRNFLTEWEFQGSRAAKAVMALYRKHGEWAAAIAARLPLGKRLAKALFGRVLAKAERHYGL